jgi:thymidylate kinase
MRVIEFTGLPGGGKTTLWRVLLGEHGMIGRGVHTIDSIKADRMSKKTRPKSVAGVLDRLCMTWQPYRRRSLDYYYLQAHRGLLLEALVEKSELVIEALDATSHLSDAFRQFVTTEFLRNLADYECARQYLEEGEVFCGEGGEGFCRGVTNIYGRYKGDDVAQRISRYVSLCPPIDILVYVQVDPGLALRRLKKRDGGSTMRHAAYAGMTDETILMLFQTGVRLAELGMRMFRERGTRIVEIDTTDGGVGQAANECAGKLRSMGLEI